MHWVYTNISGSYKAQNPDPPKVLMDAAIKRWELIDQNQELDMNHSGNSRT